MVTVLVTMQQLNLAVGSCYYTLRLKMHSINTVSSLKNIIETLLNIVHWVSFRARMLHQWLSFVNYKCKQTFGFINKVHVVI